MDCNIYVINAYSFQVFLAERAPVTLAPGVNNLSAEVFSELVAHPDIEMYESLGWIKIFDGRVNGAEDSTTGLVLADVGGDEGLPVADVDAKSGNATIRKTKAK